ncbi:hypothetical protein BPOR_0036g00140 [Botrytis porri]|uniref:Uncharacterized protein n=1 Tax=Botrytis porri TaxID=87229 RepID=A0A4Z1L2Z2_9HELO|nr:hypothetical protein BPOR_0036g00140 [Botrytis porri]
MTARFKTHTTCPSKYKTNDGECSVADQVEGLCVGSTEAMNPCSEVPSNRTFPNQTASAISLNSRNKPPASAHVGHDATPSAEVERHTGVAKRDLIMVDVLPKHSTHSDKLRENSPSTLNSQTTPPLSPTDRDIVRNQTSPTSVLPKEPLPNAIYVSNSTQSYDFPMASSRTLKRLDDEVHRSYEEVRTLKKEIVGLKEHEWELQQINHRDREECSRAVQALQETAFKPWRAGKWLPTEHDTINLEISTLQAAMSGWIRGATSGDSQLDNLSEVFQREAQDKDALSEELWKVMIFKNDMLPEGLPHKRAKKFLLEALLAHHLFTNVFSSPFFFLGDQSTSLDSMYRTGLSWSVADANKWRSDTLRLLSPEASRDDKAEAVRLKIPPLLDDRANIQAANFFRSPARCFFVTTPELTISLQKIY